jgi:hypothetical protein
MSTPVTPEATPPQGQLDYAKTAAQIGQDLAAIREFASNLGLKNSTALCDEVDARLREHRFTVAVVGEFKTGKSTFVNALLGVDVVPTDVIPATATLNRMTYGMESRIDVVFKDGHRESVGFDKLKEYVTKEFVTTDLLNSLDEVVVYHPAPYLLNNVDIIDTPGLNDESSMTSVTLSVLPKIDAAILVISGLAPFSDYTRQFLEERLLSSDLGRVIFLVNRIGQLGGKENADRIVSHIEQRITQNVLDRAKREMGEDSPQYAVYVKKIGKPRVYGIDAYDALQGILHNDVARFERSRFAPFQDGLRRFLNEDRGAIVLQVPVNRLLAAASEILMTLDLRRDTANMSLGDFNVRRESAAGELSKLRERKQEQFKDVARLRDNAAEAATDLLRGLTDRVKAGVREAIGGIELTDDEAAKGREAAEKAEAAVNVTVRRIVEQEMDRVAGEVNRTVAQASDQLQKLSSDLQETVKNIAVGFTASYDRKDQIGLAAMSAAALAIGGPLPVLGGIWSGYRQAGLAGAVTGGVTTFAATYAAAMVAAVIGLPITLPVAIGAALIGFFGGDRVTKLIFKGARAKTFKENAITQTLKQIDDMNLESTLAVAVRKYVQQTFDRLTQMVSKDIDSVIENTQRTLDQLALQKERQEVLTQEQSRELDQIGERTRTILERAKIINNMLVARAAGAAA